MGIDEDGDRVSTAAIRWEVDRPMKSKRAPVRNKTDTVLELAIKEVGLPAEVEVLRAAFL